MAEQLRVQAACVLAGGHSSRFGSDKARAVADGKPLIAHMLDVCAPFADQTRVVADRADRYLDLGLAGIADREAHLGPMGGLLAALEFAAAGQGDGWVLLGPCDVLGFRPEWLRLLLAGRAPGVSAVAFRDAEAENGRGAWQPLPGLYHTDLIPLARLAIERQQRAMWRLLEAAGAVAVPLPPDWSTARVVHTPEDLVHVRQLAPSDPNPRSAR